VGDSAGAKRFDVAFSLAAEQRDMVALIAVELERRGLSVFFYAWPRHSAELAKPNLDVQLRRIYGSDAKLLVPVLSGDYARKPWTGVVELTIVRELIFARRDDEIMPLRSDDAPVEGFSILHGYVDVRGRAPAELADLIEHRVRSLGAAAPAQLTDDAAAAKTAPLRHAGNASNMSRRHRLIAGAVLLPIGVVVAIWLWRATHPFIELEPSYMAAVGQVTFKGVVRGGYLRGPLFLERRCIDPNTNDTCANTLVTQIQIDSHDRFADRIQNIGNNGIGENWFFRLRDAAGATLHRVEIGTRTHVNPARPTMPTATDSQKSSPAGEPRPSAQGLAKADQPRKGSGQSVAPTSSDKPQIKSNTVTSTTETVVVSHSLEWKNATLRIDGESASIVESGLRFTRIRVQPGPHTLEAIAGARTCTARFTAPATSAVTLDCN
jgi:hypothetical protein